MSEKTNEIKRLNLDHIDNTSHDGKHEVCKCDAQSTPHVHSADGIHDLEHYNWHLGDTKEQYREEVRKAEEERKAAALAATAGVTATEYDDFKKWKADKDAAQAASTKPAGMSDAEWAELQEFRANRANPKANPVTIEAGA